MIKKMYTVLALAGFCFFIAPAFAASAHAAATNSVVANDTEASAIEIGKAAESDWKNLSAKEKREKRKEVRQAIRDAKESGTRLETLLLVIVAILLPPLAMAIYDGITKRFWISLILTLLGYIPGLIYTLVVILGGK